MKASRGKYIYGSFDANKKEALYAPTFDKKNATPPNLGYQGQTTPLSLETKRKRSASPAHKNKL